jgi:hypothetical protein
MNSKIILTSWGILALISCDFRQSVQKDLVTGLKTRGDGLSCDAVYLSADEEQISRNTFIYGETFYINFSNIDGFNKENNNAFPGMFLYVTSEEGDTIMQTDDLYADYISGISLTPMVLKAKLTVARPVLSDKRYTLSIKIWDKRADGTFTAELPFSVTDNEKIIVEKNNASCNEIYLFSKERNKAITDGKAGFNETVYIIFEGISGFYTENGKVYAGLKVVATDNTGNVVLANDDLFKSYEETGISEDDFNSRIYTSIVIHKGEIANPVLCEITIFDRKSEASIKVKTELVLD